MSTVAFLNIGMHGHVNPTLPVVSELVRRGHTVTYHTWPAFREAIEATGAAVHLYPGGALRCPNRSPRSRCWRRSPAPPYACCPPSSTTSAASAPT